MFFSRKHNSDFDDWSDGFLNSLLHVPNKQTIDEEKESLVSSKVNGDCCQGTKKHKENGFMKKEEKVSVAFS